MEKTKAQFRAIRERIGLSQKMLADKLGNNVDTIKKWENPKYYSIPDDAWKYLNGMLDDHIHTVQHAVATIRRLLKAEDSHEITLTYYRCQQQCAGNVDYRIVNARMREIAVLLAADGVDVGFSYPAL